MRAIKAKLHSRQGVSILFAILLLLAGSMVSMVILNAATTAAQRSHDDRVRQQETLTLNSASGLVRDLLGEVNCTITDSTRDPEGGGIWISGLGGLSSEWEPVVRYVYNRSGASGERTLSIVPDAIGGESPEKVTFTYTISADYRVEGTFTLEGSQRKLYLKAPAEVDDSGSYYDSRTVYYTVHDPETNEDVEESYEETWLVRVVRFRWDPERIAISTEAG